MLVAYYSKGCESHELFDDLVISKMEGYTEHLNKYNVIYLNIQRFLSSSDDIGGMLRLLKKRLVKDLQKEFPGVISDPDDDITFSLEEIYDVTGNPFVF